MAHVKEIKKSVKKLSTEDLQLFREWFREFDAEFWDEQIAADTASGKLDVLADSAINDYKKGDTREF